MLDKEEPGDSTGPPAKKRKSCVILGEDGETLSYEEFLEANAWIDGDQHGFQNSKI